MHTYSINSNERKSVPFVLAGISIAITLSTKNYVPHWVPVPSVFALYGLLYAVFDKWVWKWPIWYNSGLVHTPNLNGSWTHLSKSHVHNYEREYTGNIQITQTWTKISIYLDGEKFMGQSTMAGFDIRTVHSFMLKWEYLSQKKPEFSDDDYMHYGMTRLLKDSSDEPMTLKGDYFTDKSRHSYGPVTIIKKA